MIRNRIALLGTLTIITMSLAGCGGNNSSGNSTASPAEGSNVTAEEGTGAAAGEDSAKDAAEGGNADAEEKNAVDKSIEDYSVTMESGYKEYPDGSTKETAKIVCTDSEDKIIWEKEVESRHSATELTQVQAIGLSNGVYYYNWSGTVVALDVKNGNELWNNPDFGGASLQSAFTDDGRIVLCGYYGPACYVCSTKGETLAKIGEMGNWNWPYELEIVDGYAEIRFDQADGEGLAKVDLKTYEYELVR